MKRSEVDFSRIYCIHQMLLRMSGLTELKDLSRFYFIIDPQVRQCILDHHDLHRSVRRTDFIYLTPRDLLSEDYLRNRLRKMITTYEILMSFDKTYPKILYNKGVEIKKIQIEY